MCFSSTVSLAVGGALPAVGVYCLATAARKCRAYLPLASLPLLFGVQQLFEAGVWLGLERDDPTLVRAGGAGFLFFAVAFWPIWVPIAVGSLEGAGVRRWAIHSFAAIGIVFAVGGYLPLLSHPETWSNVRIVHHSLQYDFGGAQAGGWAPDWVWVAVYLTAICGPMFLSTARRVRTLGIAALVSAVVSYLFFEYAFSSVWCFLAALLSAYIGYIVWRLPAKAAWPRTPE